MHRSPWPSCLTPLVLLLAACATVPATSPPVGPEPAPPPLLDARHPGLQVQAPDTFRVLFETTTGEFVLTVYRAWAPLGADRLHHLVRIGYFDGVRFFRVVPRFVVQFGPHGDPAVNAVWRAATFPDDSVRASNQRGTVTYATAGPNTRSMQLFINLVDNTRLDAQGFAPVGRVTGGMDVIDRLHAGYGEMAPRGSGPDQGRIFAEGEAYLAAGFPELDRIRRARILPDD